MAAGDLSASTIYTGDLSGINSGINSAISSTTLPAATDTINIIPIEGRDNQVVVIRIVREA